MRTPGRSRGARWPRRAAASILRPARRRAARECPGERVLHQRATEHARTLVDRRGPQQRIHRGQRSDARRPCEESTELTVNGHPPVGCPNGKGGLGCAEPWSGRRIDEASRGGHRCLGGDRGRSLAAREWPSGSRPPPRRATSPWSFTVGVTGDLNSANPFKQIDSTESFVVGPDVRRVAPAGPAGLRHRAGARHRVALPEIGGISADGLTWTFHLREGLTWSDGVPITAHDFVWTGNFIMDNDISSWSDGYRFTESIEATDDRTIVWKTTRPTLVPGLPGYSLILPEHVWGEMSVKEVKEFKNYPDPVVSGPFNLAEWKQGEYWTMTRGRTTGTARRRSTRSCSASTTRMNPSCRRCSRGRSITRRSRRRTCTKRCRAGPGSHGGNERRGLLADVVQRRRRPGEHREPRRARPEVRKAVAYAIDRQALVDRVLKGYATPGTTPIVPRLRLLALGAAARGVPQLRPHRGQPSPRRSRLPRHRRRRHPRGPRRTANR